MSGLNRRQLAKGILGGVAGSTLVGPLVSSGIAQVASAAASSGWKPVAPGVWCLTVGSPEIHSPVRDRLIPPATDEMHRLPQESLLAPPKIAATIDHRGTHLRLPLFEGELMYGFGLQLMSFQQRSKKRTIRVNADPKGDSGDSHAPVPFYITTRGYGILVDTFRHAQFYCGEVHPKPSQPQTAGQAAVNTPRQMRERDRQNQSEVLVEVPRAAGVDVYYFAGPSMMEAVQRYNLFSGGGVNPPEWGLGFWYRPEQHLSQEAVLKLAHEFREQKIPCDVIGLEPGWQTHAYSCSFAWESARFPDPKQFVQQARSLGYRVNLWEHAFTHPSSPIFSALQPHSGNYAVWEGLVPDFAGEPARRIFGDYHGKALIDIGISGFKLDECDNSDFTEGWSWPDNSSFPSGLDGEQMHAAFGLKYQHAVLAAFQQRQQSTYSLVRSSGALASPYPFVLYSDLYDHRQFVRALINAGFSGLLWCPEVRDADNEEDLIRRLQTVVFSPLAMVNAWYIKNPPWKQIEQERNNRDEFAANWQELETRCREILGWRMSLVPYLRSAFAKYAADGTPVFRSPLLDFPQHKALQTADDQYMMGDRLLVAPLFAGEKGRDVVLPPGNWHDFWTGEHLAGEQTIRVNRDRKEIPIYIKENAVIPWAEPSASTEDSGSRQLSVRVYGNGSGVWDGKGEDLNGVRLGASRQVSIVQASNARRPYQLGQWNRIG